MGLTSAHIILGLVVLVGGACGGLLQNIRNSAFMREILEEGQGPRDPRAAMGEQESFFEQNYPTPKPPSTSSGSSGNRAAPCPIGDFLCLAARNMKAGFGNEMSNAIVGSVATLLTDMLNSTISRSLELMAHARSDPSLPPAEREAEARAAVNMVGNAISSVSSRVIQGFASFLKVSMGGALKEFLGTVLQAADNKNKVGLMEGNELKRSSSTSPQ